MSKLICLGATTMIDIEVINIALNFIVATKITGDTINQHLKLEFVLSSIKLHLLRIQCHFLLSKWLACYQANKLHLIQISRIKCHDTTTPMNAYKRVHTHWLMRSIIRLFAQLVRTLYRSNRFTWLQLHLWTFDNTRLISFFVIPVHWWYVFV